MTTPLGWLVMQSYEYVYIFEDGTVQWHRESPSATDLECIADGTLQVLQCRNVSDVDKHGKDQPLTECGRSNEDSDGDWYHEPA